MAEIELNDSDAALPDRHSARDAEDVSAWVVSVCFWGALTIAAVCYGAVALAPKFSMWAEARAEYRSNGIQLADLEKKVDYLERVKTTLETDSEFVQRLTESSKPVQRNAEQISVSGNLLFGGEHEDSSVPSITDSTASVRSGFIFQLASNTQLRSGLLIFSACLTVFAFTFLNDAGTSLVNLTARLLGSAIRLPIARYVTRVDELDQDSVHP